MLRPIVRIQLKRNCLLAALSNVIDFLRVIFAIQTLDRLQGAGVYLFVLDCVFYGDYILNPSVLIDCKLELHATAFEIELAYDGFHQPRKIKHLI